MKRIAAVLLAGALSCASSAAADERDPAAAEVAFERAKLLMRDGPSAEACALFAESHRLDPGVGVLLYLGDCYEKIDKTASAWAAFREAAAAARARDQPDRQAAAEERIAALEPKLRWLVVTVREPAAGMVVARGEQIIGEALWGERVPIDPGTHVVTATAAGHAMRELAIEAPAPGETLTLVVPALVPDAPVPQPPVPGPPLPEPPLPPPPPAPPVGDVVDTPAPPPMVPPVDSGAGWSSQHTAAVVVGAVGVVGLGVGAVLGGLTFSTWADAKERCSGDGEPLQCDAEGVRLGDRAAALGIGSTVGFVVGAAALAGGVTLWLTAPDLDTAVRVGPDGMSWRLRF